MIIKSLGRKAGRLSRGRAGGGAIAVLVRYLNRGIESGRGKAVLWRNFFAGDGTPENSLIGAFEANAGALPPRRNGNVLYHEILAFSGGISIQGDALHRALADIGEEYLERRAPDQLAYGVVHQDTGHVHLHLMISANAAGKADRVRLSKAQFTKIQQDIEALVLERYPELAQTRVYNRVESDRPRDRLKRNVREQAMGLRTGAPSRKELLKTLLLWAFARASSAPELDALLSQSGVTLYWRGKTPGVMVQEYGGGQRKHRLASLGVLHDYEVMQRRLSRIEALEVVRARRVAKDRCEDAQTQACEAVNPDRCSAGGSAILLPGQDVLFTLLNMNVRDAKSLVLTEFIGRLGYLPARVRWVDHWYRSPFRPQERTPSFKVDAVKNVWYDFGAGQGGTIIDLVQLLYQTDHVSRALAIIADVAGGVARRLEPAVIPRMEKAKPLLEALSPIEDRRLEQYVMGRWIPLDLARRYLQQAKYQVDGRLYTALAFPNESGGYELRNSGFKGTLGTKDVSYFAGPSGMIRAVPVVSVYEGHFDFLAHLAERRLDHVDDPALVLNSVAMVERGVARLRAGGLGVSGVIGNRPVLQTYFDHDAAGRAALGHLALVSWQVVGQDILDQSRHYAGFKDYSAYWEAKQAVRSMGAAWPERMAGVER